MSNLELIQAIAYPGKVTNEDLSDHNSRAAWIFDGASGIGPKLMTSSPSDPFWLVHAMNAAVKKHWRDDKPTSTLLGEAADEVIELFLHEVQGSVPPMSDRPTACWLMARLWDGQLELSTVGDCCLVHTGRTGATSFGGKISDELVAPVRKELKRLKAEGVDAENLADLLLPLERAFRSKANIDGGSTRADRARRRRRRPLARDFLLRCSRPGSLEAESAADDPHLERNKSSSTPEASRIRILAKA